ncbi:glycoside hydrolase family 75 protein [Methylobacterium nonmethylotrophicum]|uniref:Uncharacterized protein n=1 Tax=Methylobacterium nonmethylotrophicum TaxID=1141884 RepID=A0A4Z0NJR8_9HYPH|nr:glycoside hydrolase family 75 protein [Methylobacterium nonmethylotrophicum]TGD96588.1 hypothetical protein EU555_22800 [Methylobacterium nonmethylotrophicum]
MSTMIAKIGKIEVFQDDDGRVHWESGAAIDADGANGQKNVKHFAYRRDDHGLDLLQNAGYPDGDWRGVLLDRGDGEPLDDGHGNLYSQTTYAWKGRPIATRYVDAKTVPYVVVNPIVRHHAVGVVIGCHAQVSFQGKTIEAVVADVSGATRIGELSIRAAELLEIPSSPKNGGVSAGVRFAMWPGRAAVIDEETYELQRA